jgi:BolA family transcriptional regulator, general stress-responsive regulator
MKLSASIEIKIQKNLQPLHWELVNESHLHSAGREESHFRLLAVSESFEGLSRVQRQQLVYQWLAEELKNGVHALSLRLLTPQEWQEGQGAGFVSPSCQSKTRATK